MKKLNKRDIVDLVAEQAHLTKKEARASVDVVFDLIAEALLNGQEVNITNFGVFESKVRQARNGTDPKTHKIITIEETKTITFKPAQILKDKLN